ncbi:MAG: class I adenylate-forming enzyme family protein, partial [Candidatus Binatia bacterium]
LHTHGTLVRQTWNLASRMPLAPGDVLYNPSPFFWVGGLVMGLLIVLTQGATLAGQDRFEAGAALEFLAKERVTMAMAWPHFGAAMASHPDFAKTDLSSLRAGNLYELLDPSLRPTRKDLRSNALGMTETAGVHSMANWSVDLPERLAGAFGRPMPGVEHAVIDPETSERAAPGVLGEICVRGFTVTQGIYKQEREETFDREGFFHTGDLGFFDDDGWLHFAGRDSEMIKTGGANVSAREVELVLAEDPRVKAAYVVGVPDATRGALVAAAVVPHEAAAIEPGDLERRVRESLAAYKVPKVVVLLGEGDVPLKDSGKVDKRGLAEIVANRAAKSV